LSTFPSLNIREGDEEAEGTAMISTIRELKNNSEVYIPCNYSDLVKESIHLPDVCIVS
jgi:hypothetical protein